MIDPAALGTLIIGLNADQADAQGHRRTRPVTASTRSIRARLVLASGLRRAAELLDRPAIREGAGS